MILGGAIVSIACTRLTVPRAGRALGAVGSPGEGQRADNGESVAVALGYLNMPTKTALRPKTSWDDG